MKKILSLLSILGLFTASNPHVSCEFTGSDIDVIGNFNKYFSSQYLVFVEDREDVGLTGRLKSIEPHVYFTVVNSSHLGNILANNVSQLNFLRRRTTIVTKEALNLTSLLDKVSSPHFLTWVIFKDHTLFPGLYIPVNSNVFFVQSTPEVVSVKQVYHLKYGVNETVREMEGQDRSAGLNNLNFQGLVMDMLFLMPKESCQNVRKRTLLKKLECINRDFIKLMGEKLNFSINEVECMEKKFPFVFPNGSDSELLLKIKNREIDFSAIGHVVSTRGRRPYIDFIWPTFVLKSMMYLKEGRLAGRWTSYLKPLESSVWWGILISIVAFGVLLQIFEKMLSDSLKFNTSLLLGFITSGLKALQVFCNQGVADLPASSSIRIVYFLELFVVLIFFQAYSGYLVSSLTIIAPHFPFLDLEGFFANPQYKMMTLRIGVHQYFYRNVIAKDNRTDFILPVDELPETIQQAVDKLCSRDHLAFTEFREDLLDFDTLKCRISELPKPMLHLYVGIALPKSSPLKEFLRRELLNLMSTGIMRRLGSRLSSQSDFRDERSHNEFASVSMSHIFSIFILLGTGILLSVVVFVFELMAKTVKRRSVGRSLSRKKK